MSRIGVLLLTDADVFAGTERHILALAMSLPRDRVRVSVGCPAPSPLADAAAAGRVPVVPIAMSGLLDRSAIIQLRGMLKSGEIDVIHAHNGRTALTAVLAACLAGRGKVIVTQHFLQPDHLTRRGLGGWVYRRAHDWVNRSIDHFVAISDAVGAAMLERGDAAESRISRIPNGIVPPDLELLSACGATRMQLGIAAEAPLIVCVARLQPEKDIPTLVAAIKKVVAVRSDAACIIAGEGSSRDEIAHLIDAQGMADHVILLGFRNDAAALIAAGDLFALPSPAEPFGLVLLEAMAMQRPVIAVNNGGPSQIVRDGETGLLVPPSDPAALAGAILQLLDDRQLSHLMGRQGYLRFQQHFTAASMALQTADVYERVMRQSLSPAPLACTVTTQ